MHGSTCHLNRCTLSDSKSGICVKGAGSNAHAGTCHLLRNTQHGAGALEGATLAVSSCTSSGNPLFAYYAGDAGSVLELTDCVSDDDGACCQADRYAKLSATRVAATRCRLDGFALFCAAPSVLKECSAKACGGDGVVCSTSNVHVEGCTLKNNSGCGVMAENYAKVTVKGCHSSGHSSAAGYCASEGTKMLVSGSVSEQDKVGCSIDMDADDTDEELELTMQDVTVNGTLQSGQLPRRNSRGALQSHA